MKIKNNSPLKLLRRAVATIALPTLMVATSRSEETVLPEDLPDAVRKALEDSAPRFVPDKIEVEDDDGQLVYEFEGLFEEQEVEIEITEGGEVLENENEDDESEEEVAISDVPDAVLAAALNAVRGLEISEVEKEASADGDMYEIEGLLDGKEIELLITADGAVLEMEMDSDGDELGDKDEADTGSDPEDPDSDDDSFPDGFEAQNGSDPTNAEDVPDILELNASVENPEKEVILGVATFEGKTFTLEHCPDGQNWSELGIDIAGDGQTHEIRIVVEDGADCGFFRIRIHDKTSPATR